MLLEGVFPPVTTPFYPDGRVYLRKLEHNIARYSKTPVAGMVILGSSGEAILLNDQERREVLKCAREAASPHKVLIAGTGSESAIETLRLTEYAAELGYDVAMVRTPYYYRDQTASEHVLAFYRFVGDCSPLPLLLYNLPQSTGYDIPPEVVIALSEHPNILGIKESAGSNEKIARMVEGTRSARRTVKVTETFQALTPRMLHVGASSGGPLNSSPSSATTAVGGGRIREKEIGFQVLTGSAQAFYEALRAGASGGILSFADPAPMAMYEIYSAWREGDTRLAEEKQRRVLAAVTHAAVRLGIAGVKYACDLNGYYGGPVRLPLLPLTAEQKTQVERLMAEIKC